MAVECGEWIYESTVLTEDLYCDSHQGLIINADNVVLDCDGHRISNSFYHDGANVHVFDSTDVTIKNCVLNGTHVGVQIDAFALTLINPIDYLGLNKIINNTIHNTDYGIFIFGAKNNTITNNTVWNTILSAIDTSEAGNLNITGNKIYSRGEPLDIGASGNLIIKDNNIDGGEAGAFSNLINSAESLLFTNNIVKNVGELIFINEIEGAIIVNNTFLFIDRLGTGIYFASGSNNALVHNNVFYTNYYGVWGVNLLPSTNSNISNNNFTGMSRGVQAFTSGHVIEHNNFWVTTDKASEDNGNSTWRNNYYLAYDEEEEGCYDSDQNLVCDDPYPLYGGDNHDTKPYNQPSGWLKNFKRPSGSPILMKKILTIALEPQEAGA